MLGAGRGIAMLVEKRQGYDRWIHRKIYGWNHTSLMIIVPNLGC